jgi:hypothetical protein
MLLKELWYILIVQIIVLNIHKPKKHNKYSDFLFTFLLYSEALV